ncbi:hypothetical protein ACFLTP_05130 [Chloroflexota bacterium]
MVYIFFPRQLGAIFGHDVNLAFGAEERTVFAFSLVAFGIFLIIASLDPLKHILWVKYAIVFAILSIAAYFYIFILGYTNSASALTAVIIHAIFVAALLVFYPWRAVKGN